MSRVASSSRFLETLENRQLLSLVVDLRAPGGGKTANVSSVGQVVNLEIWAKTTGSNSSGNDESLQRAVGSLLSTNVSTGAANGTLKATLSAPFNALGSSNGAQTDLDGDGDLDVGSNFIDNATSFLYARSDELITAGAVSGAAKEFKIGTATFTVTSLKSTTGQTNLVWRIRNATTGALWREDNNIILKNPSNSSYSGGAAFVIKRGGTTPTVGSIAGNVFTDTDGDGVKDTGETGRSGVKVFIDADKDGVFDSTEKNTTTDSSGNYKFSSLNAASYRVRIVKPSGFRISTPSSGYHEFSLGSGSNVTGKNFGVTQRVLISGRLWVDSDKDGVKDSAEAVLSNWTVYIDKDKDGVFDSGEVSTKTDSSGNYSFKSLAAGSYRVRVVQLSGHTRISPTSGYYDLNSLGNGSEQKNKNFRYTKP